MGTEESPQFLSRIGQRPFPANCRDPSSSQRVGLLRMTSLGRSPVILRRPSFGDRTGSVILRPRPLGTEESPQFLDAGGPASRPPHPAPSADGLKKTPAAGHPLPQGGEGLDHIPLFPLFPFSIFQFPLSLTGPHRPARRSGCGRRRQRASEKSFRRQSSPSWPF